jgi:predicted signal transduction protein with EAL and GGDEF domain
LAALRVTVSAGVAPLDGEADCEVLLAHPDLALYEAKNAGRNRARLFAPDTSTGRRWSTRCATSASTAGQGYYLGRPGRLEDLLARHRSEPGPTQAIPVPLPRP